MIQITLNLLSPKQKDYLRYEHAYLYVRTITVIMLSFTVVLTSLFLTARYVLKQHYQDSLSSANLLVNKNSSLDKEISQLNSSLKNVQSIQRQFIKWTSLLTQTMEVIPTNVSLTYLSFDASQQTVNLSGQAKQRDDLLQLKSNLTQLPFITSLASPLANLILRENVKFELTGKLKLNNDKK